MWSTICPSERNTVHQPLPLLSRGELRSLQLECLLLVASFFFFSSPSLATVWAILDAFQCWWCKQGAISPPHMWLQLRKRKGPQSRRPLWLAALFEIPPSRCYTNWTRFHVLKERRKWGANLPAATLQPFFKWWTIRPCLCCAVSLMIWNLCRKVFVPEHVGSHVWKLDPYIDVAWQLLLFIGNSTVLIWNVNNIYRLQCLLCPSHHFGSNTAFCWRWTLNCALIGAHISDCILGNYGSFSPSNECANTRIRTSIWHITAFWRLQAN